MCIRDRAVELPFPSPGDLRALRGWHLPLTALARAARAAEVWGEPVWPSWMSLGEAQPVSGWALPQGLAHTVDYLLERSSRGA
eukprot:561282-Alexandrium_andersonii.AAC.1